MGERTDIQWCDHTWNPWIGCTRVSPACDHCYAEGLARRWGWVKWGPGEARQRTSEENWRKLLLWDRKARKAGVRRRVFVASLADWADVEVPAQWRGDMFAAESLTTNLDYLMLTKRHALAEDYLTRYAFHLRDCIRVGFTVEDQKAADMRLPRLERLAQNGWRTFVSYEPALGPVDWRPWLERGVIGWLIAGGESGHFARPAHPDWFRAARDACAAARVPFFFKQWGAWSVIFDRELDDPDWRRCDVVKRETPRGQWLNLAGGQGFHGDRVVRIVRTSKEEAGATLDGIEHQAFPQ